MSPLQAAITYAGSQAKLARALGVSDAVICNWKRRGVPLERCAQIERALAGKVTRAQLRPDVFGALQTDTEAA